MPGLFCLAFILEIQLCYGVGQYCLQKERFLWCIRGKSNGTQSKVWALKTDVPCNAFSLEAMGNNTQL